MNFRKTVASLSVISSIVLAAGTYSVPAHAEFNWSRHMGGNIQRRDRGSDGSNWFFGRSWDREQPEEQTQPVVIPKVKSPTYYTYKAHSPSRIDFRQLIAALAEPEPQADPAADEASQGAMSAPIEPAPVMNDREAAFRSAVPYLADYRYAADKKIADAIVAYYSAHPEFIWVTDGKPNPRARVALNVLKKAEQEGLDPGDYVVGLPEKSDAVSQGATAEPERDAAVMPKQASDATVTMAGAGKGLTADARDVMADPQETGSTVADDTPGADAEMPAATGEPYDSQLIRFEMAMSARVLRYAMDQTRGRVDPNRLSGYHDLPVLPFDAEKALAELSSTPIVASWLADKAPHGTEYAELKRELARLRASTGNQIVIDRDLLMKPGSTDPEFAKVMQVIKRDATPELTAQFGDLIEAGQGSDTYAPEYAPLIKAVQKSHGLAADGVIGRHTVGALTPASKSDRIAKVKFALERLRWLPHVLGARRVIVNQPEFVVRYYTENKEKLAMRVIVGKPTNQTSFFYDEIEKVDFNPYWGVPRSIIVNEMLPRLLKDPGYLDRAGYEVTDSRGRRVPSAAIDWGAQASNITYDIRQTPGEANALGELKILFPNKHAIYMHDTPSKSLFNRDTRAFSHGCIRLQQPREMAAAVLSESVNQVVADLGKGHHTKQVPVRIPIYVSYFTAWPDKNGNVGYFADIYGRDSHLEKALEAERNARDAAS